MVRRPDVPLPFAGQVDPVTGRARCGWCGTAVSGRRRSWCSDVCVLHYLIAKGDQGAARKFLWKKERGVCQLCRVDVNKRRRQIKEKHGYVPRTLFDQTKWDADHTIPIVEGGPCAIDNLRTLCRVCHKSVTKSLLQRLAAQRRKARA